MGATTNIFWLTYMGATTNIFRLTVFKTGHRRSKVKHGQ